MRERAGLPPEPETPGKREREPAAVLADVLARDGAAKSATEIAQAEAANADHLATLHAIWQGELAGPRTERYTQILRDTLPAEYAAGAADSPQATWLWRTLRGVEAAGLDARQAVADAVNSRSLDGARDVAAVVDARIRERAGSLTPRPQPSWAEQVPEVADPQTQDLFRALATWMDERTERLGKHAADARPEWATAALGEVPADPQQRAGWEQRASRVAAYRELYGYDHPADPIGPEPTAESPEQRAAWHAGLAALGPADGPDLRGLSEGELWLRRDTYQAETAWAPRHVAEELRLARLGAQNMQIDSVRAEAEAAAAEANGKHEEAGRRRAHAESARVLHEWYQQRSSELEPQDTQYREWEHITEPSRRLAVAADAELRRRQPGRSIEPLKSAEPEPVTGPEREELLSPRVGSTRRASRAPGMGRPARRRPRRPPAGPRRPESRPGARRRPRTRR